MKPGSGIQELIRLEARNFTSNVLGLGFLVTVAAGLSLLGGSAS